MAGDTDRRPFRASNSEMGSKPGGTESVLCEKMYKRTMTLYKRMHVLLFSSSIKKIKEFHF